MSINDGPAVGNDKDAATESSLVQAVDRALTLLNIVAESEHPILIGDIVEKAAMNRTTAWRLLLTLEYRGFVERDPVTKGYQIGYAATQLSQGTSMYDPLVRRAHASMEKLGEISEETVLLSVPKHLSTLTIYQIDPKHSVRLVDYVNAILPLHSTSNGKLLLSTLPNRELDILLQQSLEQCSPFTITDPKYLRKEIELVRERGFGTALGELDENENGISAPIYDSRNRLIAFLSVCGPNFRFTKDKVFSIAPLVIETAKEIANQLDIKN